MDRRSKHFSSEERGVIFAEHGRGSSQRVIGAKMAETKTSAHLLSPV
jgi:hypothetical protein